MKKRILSVLLCGILLANLAGCAGKSQSASDVSDESAFQAEQIGKTEAAAQTASSQEEQTAPESVEETASTQPPAEEEKETPQEQTEGKKPASTGFLEMTCTSTLHRNRQSGEAKDSSSPLPELMT